MPVFGYSRRCWVGEEVTLSTTTTGIDWTDRTWNPLRGCTRVSAGCQHCYAETLAYRFSGPGQPYEGLVKMTNGHPQWTGEIRLVESAIEEPLHWRTPARIFVNSMSDLFHPSVPDAFILRVWKTMRDAPQHTFQILTKRPKRMRHLLRRLAWMTDPDGIGRGYFAYLHEGGDYARPLPNVWIGVSAEDQERAAERIPILLDTPAAVRFVSAEPLLGPIDLSLFAVCGRGCDALVGHIDQHRIPGLNWVIAGGESGSGARPLEADWLRDLVLDCKAYGVAPFVKQFGSAWATERRRNGLPADSHGSDWQYWPESLRVREFPSLAVPA